MSDSVEQKGTAEVSKKVINWFVVCCDDWCSVASSTWLTTDRSYVYWPPEKCTTTKCMDRGNIPGPTWSKHKVRKINGPYGNMRIARDVEKELSFMSSSDENFYNIFPDYKLPEKRPRRPKIVTSSEEEEEMPEKIPKVTMESPPWSFRTKKDNSERSTSTVCRSPLKEVSQNRNLTQVLERNGKKRDTKQTQEPIKAKKPKIIEMKTLGLHSISLRREEISEAKLSGELKEPISKGLTRSSTKNDSNRVTKDIEKPLQLVMPKTKLLGKIQQPTLGRLREVSANIDGNGVKRQTEKTLLSKMSKNVRAEKLLQNAANSSSEVTLKAKLLGENQQPHEKGLPQRSANRDDNGTTKQMGKPFQSKLTKNVNMEKMPRNTTNLSFEVTSKTKLLVENQQPNEKGLLQRSANSDVGG